MAATNEHVLKGSCRCGAITYTSTSLPIEITNCHCLTCRKISGSPYLAFAGFPASSLTYTSTKPNALRTTSYSEVATRTHCSECGAPISMQYKFQPERVSITAGSIDEESLKSGLGVKPSEHIFLREKAEWFEVPDDGIPRFEGFPDEFQRKLDSWKKGMKGD